MGGDGWEKGVGEEGKGKVVERNVGGKVRERDDDLCFELLLGTGCFFSSTFEFEATMVSNFRFLFGSMRVFIGTLVLVQM